MCAGEENSRVQAHMDGDEFSAHILTNEAEYNVEVRVPFKVIGPRAGTCSYTLYPGLLV